MKKVLIVFMVTLCVLVMSFCLLAQDTKQTDDSGKSEAKKEVITDTPVKKQKDAKGECEGKAAKKADVLDTKKDDAKGEGEGKKVEKADVEDTKKVDTVAEEEGKDVAKKVDIQVKEIEAFNYCAVEMTGSYQQHDVAFGTLYQEAGMQNIDVNAIPFGIYWNNPADTPEDQLKWEIGLPVAKDAEVTEPLKLKTWNFLMIVTKFYEGSYESEQMGNTYTEIFQWMGKNGYVVAGPVMEKYLTQPTQDDQGQWGGKVEIVVPVQKAQ